MYPHERSLVKHMLGRPFALIGVNSDRKLETAQAAVKTNGLNWRSFWNGREGTRGPISTTWNVEGWPSIYILDHKGVLRFRDLRGKKLDEALEQLVIEAEKSKTD
ncbi:MAG: hypothetical protein ACI97A_002083 [Planctomycetota bacterium]|jgi:hypothetical protein